MLSPPKLSPSDLSDLVARVGGTKAAAKALAVASEDLAAWDANANAPQMALRLLWYYGPDGCAAADSYFHRERQYLSLERDALRDELTRARRTTDERRSALAAQVKALEVENDELRRLCRRGTQLAEISSVCSKLSFLLAMLQDARPDVVVANAAG